MDPVEAVEVEKIPEMDPVEKVPEMGPVEAVEKILNYSFENKSLLREAITLTSTSSMKSPLFERLEFLGDSVLGLAFTNHIHLECPNLDLKEQRQLRAINVCNEKLARVALNHSLYQLLILDGDPFPTLDVKVKEFSEAVSKEDGPFSYGTSVRAPKILADLVESIAGAVYVDVNFDTQRLWEIFRGLLEPIFTQDDLRQQKNPVSILSRLASKLKRRIDIRCCSDCKDGVITAEVYLDNTCIASGSAKHSSVAKTLAAMEAVRKLSECLPIEKVINEDSVVVEAEDTKGKLSEICSTEKLQIQTGSSSFPSTSENPLTYEMTPTKMVTDEDCLDVEPEDVKGEMFEICSTQKVPLQNGSSGLPTLSENPLRYEKTQKEMVVDKDSLKVGPEDAKVKLSEVCRLQIQTRSSSSLCTSPGKLLTSRRQIQTRSSSSLCTSPENLLTSASSLPTASVNPLTYEMTQKQMVIDEDCLEVKPEHAKDKLCQICTKKKWPKPIFSFEEVGGTHDKRFVCSVKIEIPTIEDTFHMKGDEKARKKQAENSSSYHMLRALKSPVMSLVIRNLGPEDAKVKLSEVCRLQIQTRSSSSLCTSPENLLTSRRQIQARSSSSLCTSSENLLTYKMTQKQMVINEDSLEVEPEHGKAQLCQICSKKKWPKPIFSFEEVGERHDKRHVCSVKIEIPTIEGTFHMKGAEKAKKKEAENSSSYHMLRALKSPLMSLVTWNSEMQESLEKNKKNLQPPKSSEEKKKRKRRKMDSVEKIPEMDPVEAVEKILKYSFENKGLLKDALMRSPHKKLSSVARLEFLGGAALALAFTNHFYLLYPNYEPKELTPLRNVNVTKEKFGRDAIKHGLYQFLIGDVPDEKARKFIEAVSKGDDPLACGAIGKAPRILSDVIETVAGAVYVDVNFDVRRLWEICRFLFEPLYTLDDLRRQPQPLATLFRLADKHGKRIEFRYCDGDADGSTVAQVYLDDTYITCGPSKRDSRRAKVAAAKKALLKLAEGMPIEMVVDEDRVDIEIEDAKEKLIEICNKRKWPNPIYSVERAGKGLVCSAVKIETPTEEGTLCIKGDKNKKRKLAEISSASHMIRALKFYLKDDL